MKKLALVVVMIISLVLSGCGGGSGDTWKAKEVSKDVQPYVERAVEIIGSYLAFEMSAAEADSNFSELLTRFEPLNVTEWDAEKHHTDIMAAYDILSFEYNAVSERTDIELRQARDILAFQIGEDVSGNAYPIEDQSNLFDEEGVPAKLQALVMPASSTYFSVTNNICYVSVNFEAVNGVTPIDLYEYTKDILNALSELPCDIYIPYYYYGQLVFSVHLTADEEGFTGQIFKCIKGNDGIRESIATDDELKAAFNSGAKFLGKYKVPALNTTKEDTTQTTEKTTADPLDYPDAIGSEGDKLLVPLLPDGVFVTTAEENGLDGTLYKIYGTVENITASSDGVMDTIHLRTHAGNIVISNLALSMEAESRLSELGTVDWDMVKENLPMPKVGEYCRIFAEYQGYSEKYKAPHFTYGSTVFLSELLVEAISIQ